MDSLRPHRDSRPWGEEAWLSRDGERPSMVKVIRVRAGEALSLQRHSKRDEEWYVISGNGTASIGASSAALSSGAMCVVPRGTTHRITGGSEELVFVECAYGDFDEGDIERLEDRYGRA